MRPRGKGTPHLVRGAGPGGSIPPALWRGPPCPLGCTMGPLGGPSSLSSFSRLAPSSPSPSPSTTRLSSVLLCLLTRSSFIFPRSLGKADSFLCYTQGQGTLVSPPRPRGRLSNLPGWCCLGRLRAPLRAPVGRGQRSLQKGSCDAGYHSATCCPPSRFIAPTSQGLCPWGICSPDRFPALLRGEGTGGVAELPRLQRKEKATAALLAEFSIHVPSQPHPAMTVLLKATPLFSLLFWSHDAFLLRLAC